MFVMVLGQLAFGPIADLWSARKVMAGACILFSISVVVLIGAKSYPIAIAFAAIYGFTMGGGFVLGPLLTGDHLGLKNFGTIYGVLNIMGTIGGGAIGPIVPGVYYDRLGTYLPVFYAFILLMILAFVLSIMIKPAKQPSESAA
jgi:MFS family permease